MRRIATEEAFVIPEVLGPMLDRFASEPYHPDLFFWSKAAEGTPLQLKDQSGAAALVITVSNGLDLGAAEALLRPHVREIHVDAGARQLTAPAEGLGHMTRVAAIFEESGIVLDDIGLKRPSLDDVFLHLTGHRAEEPQADDATTDEPVGEMAR